MGTMGEDDVLLTPKEVAEIFKVHPATVTKWANLGKLRCTRTPSGNRRFFYEDVFRVLRGEPAPED